MANTILDKFGTATAMTITLASLASSAAGVGRQSTTIDNSTVRAPRALVFVKVTVGTTPTANTLVRIYLIRSDGTITDDGAGASDAALTVINSPLLGTILVPAATSDTAYYGVFDTYDVGPLGPTWGVAVVQNTAVNLNATGGNHAIRYLTDIPEIQ